MLSKRKRYSREREREKQVGLDIVQYSFDCVAKDPIIVAKSLTTKVPVPSLLLTGERESS